ncbi:MaoC family dehydratase [Streptomyces tubercidicus]|uniref:MaoC family dehydratase n=1 Tax=Streptomyces tubercidicus TaxID=47759 RepID=UPI002E19F619
MNSRLPQGYRRIGKCRVRENVGLSYSDLNPGLVIEHRPGRTVSETDNLLGTALAGNQAPIHTDAHYSSQTQWGRILVCGGVTLNLVTGMTVRSISGLTSANLALDDVRFTAPVFIGDTLYAQSEVISRRPCETRHGNGVITCRTAGHNQNDTHVLTLTRTFLIPLDADAVRNATRY